ncbi:hypothetical protein OH781_03885 [Streptomyces sp. NBC_01550]|uniref:hypothetical protein n=1 Tax=Streptomyces sp. NBC_01550 TaxID=2975875 RepID=UPI003869DDED
MPAVDAAVGAGVGATCIALSVAFQMIARKGGGSGRGGGKLLSKLEMPRRQVALWIAGGLGFAGTRLGGWSNTVLSWCNEKAIRRPGGRLGR